MHEEKIARSAAGIGIATVGSRILGFIRDVLIANFFGTGMVAQAFFAAFRIPNLMRKLLGEGALSASFIPVFTGELFKKGKDSAWDLAVAVFNILAIILALIVIAGMFFSPQITRMIVPGFASNPEKFDLTAKLLRMMFPYLFFIGLAALMMGILNSLRHFAAPAIAPIVLNISLLIFLVFFVHRVENPAVGLAIAVIIGGIGQFGIQLAVALKKGFPLGKRFVIFHPMVKKIAILMLPATIGVAVYQVNIFVDQICASFESIVGEGAIAALWYANRLMQFPLAIFGLAMATAIFPAMAGSVSKGDTDTFRERISFGLRFVFLLTIPSAVGLMVLRKPIISVLFERNEFGAYSTEITSAALLYYCIGLFAYAGVHILSRSFYSLQDMITPVKAAAAAMVFNIALNLILMHPLKVGGLSLATSISAIINFIILIYFLNRRTGGFGEKNVLCSFLRILGISAAMGIVLVAVTRLLPETASFSGRLLKLCISILTGIFTFLGILLLFKVEEFKILKKAILMNRHGKP